VSPGQANQARKNELGPNKMQLTNQSNIACHALCNAGTVNFALGSLLVVVLKNRGEDWQEGRPSVVGILFKFFDC
jgi:hypothetical protein